jgi:hypothetical protein
VKRHHAVLAARLWAGAVGVICLVTALVEAIGGLH